MVGTGAAETPKGQSAGSGDTSSAPSWETQEGQEVAIGHFIAVQGTEKGEGTGAPPPAPSPQRHFRVRGRISSDSTPAGPVLTWSSCCQTPLL